MSKPSDELWIRVSVRFFSHRKAVKAGDAACMLHLAAIAYAREQMTDGDIDVDVLRRLTTHARPKDLAAKLVEVGLWSATQDGYVIHDYADWNPTRAEIESRRGHERDKKRKQRGIDSVVPEGQGRDSHAGARARTLTSDSDSGIGLEGGPGETVQFAPIIDGRAMRRHGQHRRCYEARGLCITPWVWEELCGRIGGDPATAPKRVAAWADAEVASTGTQPIGDPPDTWWRKRFAQWQGVEAMPASTKGTRTMAAGARVQSALDAGAEIDPFGTKRIARERASAQLAEKAGA